MEKRDIEDKKGSRGRDKEKGKKGVAEMFMDAIDGSVEFISDQVIEKHTDD